MSYNNLQMGEYVLLLLCVVAGVALLLLYVLRLRRYSLLTKHASWQLEAQAVEQATHEALVSGRSEEASMLTIVVPVINEREPLKPLLQRLITQKYADAYEIIVADECHSPEVEALCESLQRTDFHNLRYTFVPNTSRYIELRKLAITLGIRAARSEWVIVVSPDTLPSSDMWLYHVSQSLSDAYDWVIPYYNYDDDGSLVARRAIFDRVCALAMQVYAWEQGHVIGCPSSGWAVRKKWFIEQNGFADSVNIAFGEEQMLACLHADAERTCLLCSPSTRLVETLPTLDVLRVKRMQACEINHHLKHYLCKYKWQDIVATLSVYVFATCQIIYAVCRVMNDVNAEQYSISMLPIDVVSLVLWGIMLVLPIVMIRRGLRTLDERKYGAYIYIYELMRPLHALANEWRRMMHQRDFERKYI